MEKQALSDEDVTLLRTLIDEEEARRSVEQNTNSGQRDAESSQMEIPESGQESSENILSEEDMAKRASSMFGEGNGIVVPRFDKNEGEFIPDPERASFENRGIVAEECWEFKPQLDTRGVF